MMRVRGGRRKSEGFWSLPPSLIALLAAGVSGDEGEEDEVKTDGR